VNSARTALSPVSLIRHGFDWSGRTARLPYIFVTLVTICLASLIPSTRNFSGANTAVFVALTMVFPVWLGHTRRRLRDVSWSGWCMWLALFPGIGLILSIFLAFKPGDNVEGGRDTRYSRLAFSVALLSGVMMLGRAFWAPYWIPTGPMKPALLVGDFVAAVPLNTPQRGDVLVFRHTQTGAEYIQRVIGLPGDTLRLAGGRVYLNEVAIDQRAIEDFVEPAVPQGPLGAMPRCRSLSPEDVAACHKTQLIESLPGGRSYATLQIGPSRADNTGLFEVPEDHYFFLGDNRDNAVDSRFDPDAGGIGFVHRENLTGRVAIVLFSSAGDGLLQVWNWRKHRFFRRVE